jgi:hypothetical protein
MKELLTWTNGQPFVTQKLCEIVVKERNCGSKYIQENRVKETDERYKLDYHLPIINHHLIDFFSLRSQIFLRDNSN